jgi:hypothetical protein
LEAVVSSSTPTPQEPRRRRNQAARARAKANADAQWLADHPGCTLEDRARALSAFRRRVYKQMFPRNRKLGRLRAAHFGMPDDFDGSM